MRNESPVTNWEPPMSEKGLDESYAAIREALEKNNRGNVVNSLQNCVLALTHDPLLGGHIRRNLFNERLTIDSPLPWVRESSVISDTDLAFLQLHLERHYGLKAERCLPGALKIAATDNAFHPVRDRLRALRWDGVPRVRNALHHFLGAEVNDYHERCLRTFMLGAVRRVFQPGCKFELMLVLVGGQGAGKSTFLRSLALEPDWFSDDLRNLSDKDVFHRLNGRWIIEMSEMVATANARSIEEIKAFLSRDRTSAVWPTTASARTIPGSACSRAPPTAWISCPWIAAETDVSSPCRWTPARPTATSWMARRRPGCILSKCGRKSWRSTIPGCTPPICPRRRKPRSCRSRRPLHRRTPWPGGSITIWISSRETSSAPCRFSRKGWTICSMSRKPMRPGRSGRSWTRASAGARSRAGAGMRTTGALPSMAVSEAGSA